MGDFWDISFFLPNMLNGGGFVWKAFTQAEGVFVSTLKSQ